jgi:hypothetical protein
MTQDDAQQAVIRLVARRLEADLMRNFDGLEVLNRDRLHEHCMIGISAILQGVTLCNMIESTCGHETAIGYRVDCV